MNLARVAAWACAAAIACGCSKSEDAVTPTPPAVVEKPPSVPRCAAGVAPLPSRIERGMCLAHNYQRGGSRGYGSETSRATLVELESLGVEWVSITPFGFMQRLDEPTVHSIGGYRAGETDERVIREIEAANALGLHVLLKPHIWVVDGQWRGHIDFDEDARWKQWFEAYETWILHYADLAEAHGVEGLVIGVELRSTERRFERRWRKLVRRIRQRFRGKLTYAANWDDAASLPWWDAIDFVGVQFYPPLASAQGASRASIDATLRARLDDLEKLSADVDRPVIFTEVGFRTANDALTRPHAWPERSGDVTIDPRVQALGYRSFLDAIRTRNWVSGVYWWKWFTDPKTTEEGPSGFSPRGKPAESILRAAYGGNCDAPNEAP